ncbi:hypothetical protein [Streptomyces sp. 1222.5]|uniref:hypothetical protein n=1 Tax=Streptomyces sp. 1222.5 TaxID=1881026 RepID=UPI003D75D0F1
MKTQVSTTILIAVPLITAVATLTAAALTAVITSSIAKRNLQYAGVQAAKDRETKKLADLRQSRRSAYASFMTACIECAYAASEKVSPEPGETEIDAWKRHKSGLRAHWHHVVQAYAVLQMEGPEEVVAAGKDARRAVRTLREAVLEARRPELSDAERVERKTKRDEVISAADRSMLLYAETARRALNEEWT